MTSLSMAICRSVHKPKRISMAWAIVADLSEAVPSREYVYIFESSDLALSPTSR